MDNSNVAISNDEINRIVKSNVDYFIWQNKKKKPIVKTIIFEN
jgi:mRNA degradation ribonuclease J1/J2